jgi:hypothetical protein
MDKAQTWIFKAGVSLRYFLETPLGGCPVIEIFVGVPLESLHRLC